MTRFFHYSPRRIRAVGVGPRRRAREGGTSCGAPVPTGQAHDPLPPSSGPPAPGALSGRAAVREPFAFAPRVGPAAAAACRGVALQLASVCTVLTALTSVRGNVRHQLPLLGY